jgi:hypothetical protein
MTRTSHPALPLKSTPAGPVPPREPEGADRLAKVKLTCDGVEVTQAIQNMAHSVPLVAEKRTLVRVYLSAIASGPIMVQGLLKVRRLNPTRPWQFVPALGPITINPAENGQLQAKRESETKSLNFLLPAVCLEGSCEIRLAKVFQTAPFKLLIPPHNARKTFSFTDSPPLRVRIIGIRFTAGNPPEQIEPSTLDFTLIRSWLRRAYPVASVEWSQVTVDAPQAWPFDAPIVNTFVRGIRTNDVLGGMDDRTHYYGLVAEGAGGFFMRGRASGLPTTPDPTTVASGPTGVNTWGWDNDGSYGDWYTGHELGHTFGRFHAEFCGAVDGAPYPFTNGQLSNADGAFIGFDTGDPAQGLAIRALPGTVWHDVMTYCSSQWLSSFTYTGIRDRLVDEEALPAGAAPGGRAARKRKGAAMGGMSTGATHVLATVNLTRGTGNLRHVTAVAAVPARQAALASKPAGRRRAGGRTTDRVALRLYGKGGRLVREYPADVILDGCLNPGDDTTGTIDTFLDPVKDASRLELLLNGSVIDAFVPGARARAVQNIRAAAPRGRRADRAEDETADPVITWAEPGSGRARRDAGPSGTGRVYTVQVSTDGKTWQTVGFGLREPRVTIDRQLLTDADTIKVRVTSSDGFHSVSSEKSLKVADL